MKTYIDVLIEDEQLIDVADAQIKDPSDELYDLQEKYNVKISRSNSSDAVYFFKTAKAKVRVGHPISKKQNHLSNFRYNVVIKGKVTKNDVEEAIIKYKDKI